MSDSVITNAGALRDLCDFLAGQPWIALDTEFVRERTYYAQLCLVQVAVPGRVACVDPLAVDDLSPFLDVVYDARIIKVMHAGRQDLELFNDLRGTPPTPVFDTQVAAMLTGYGDQVGYGPLVETIVGVKLDKAHTRTDWCRRPLSPAQIRYAEDDVRYLCDVYQFLAQKVEDMGRGVWLDEELSHLTSPATYSSDPEQAYRRLKRGGLLAPPAQQVLKALAAWRERCAQAENLPRGWVVADPVLVALAVNCPDSLDALAAVEGVKESMVRKWGTEILAAIRAGAAQEAQSLWPAPVRLSSEQKSMADRAMNLIRARAEANQLAPAVLGTRREVERFVLGDDSVALLAGWRRDLVGEALLELRSGG